MLSIYGNVAMEVVEEGLANGSILAYNSNAYGANGSGGENWLPGDNRKSFGNVSSDRAANGQDLEIYFNPDIVVTYFSIDLADYGDWFPIGGSDPREATLTAYDSAGTALSSDVLSIDYSLVQDIFTAGLRTLSVSGVDIAWVELVFADVDPGITFDNISIVHSPRRIDVDIDIKPGSYPNSFNINGSGVIPVAILGSADFDVTCIDPESLTFSGLDVAVRGKSKLMVSYEDVSGEDVEGAGPDGYVDMVIQFEDDAGAWEIGSTEGVLEGYLYDECGGTPIYGTGTINVVQPVEP